MYALVFFAVLLASGRSANVNKHMRLLEDLDNNIHHSEAAPAPRRFLSLSRAPPPRVTHAAGTTLELTCEAFAAPAPSIRWFKNDQPVYEYNQESNEVFSPSPTSLAKVTSTLLVARTAAADRYACVAAAGGQAARASTLVLAAAGDAGAEATERGRLRPRAPRVLVSYRVLMDVIGSRAALPCRARAHPRPRLAWRDNRGAPVRGHPRMKVLRSGELLIAPLLWSDMGEFTCVASNAFGSQRAATFVYPASVSRMNKVKH